MSAGFCQNGPTLVTSPASADFSSAGGPPDPINPTLAPIYDEFKTDNGVSRCNIAQVILCPNSSARVMVTNSRVCLLHLLIPGRVC